MLNRSRTYVHVKILPTISAISALSAGLYFLRNTIIDDRKNIKYLELSIFISIFAPKKIKEDNI